MQSSTKPSKCLFPNKADSGYSTDALRFVTSDPTSNEAT